MVIECLSPYLFSLKHPLFGDAVFVYRNREPTHPQCIWQTQVDKNTCFRDLSCCITYTDKIIRLAEEQAREIIKNQDKDPTLDW